MAELTDHEIEILRNMIEIDAIKRTRTPTALMTSLTFLPKTLYVSLVLMVPGKAGKRF